MVRRFRFCWLLPMALATGCTVPYDPPAVDPSGVAVAAPAVPDPIPGEKVDASRRWVLSDPAAIEKLSGTEFGEREITEFWVRKGWRTTKREELFLTQVAELQSAGAITPVTRWGGCPYATVYQTLQRVDVLGTAIERGREFMLEMDQHDDRLVIGSPRFSRTDTYFEDHAEGHATDAAK